MRSKGKPAATHTTHLASFALPVLQQTAVKPRTYSILSILKSWSYAFSTCPKSNSTGVERPKIVTDTLILLLS